MISPAKSRRVRKAVQDVPVAPAPVPPPEPAPPKGKLGVMVGLLRRPQGARIAEFCDATGWQAHSVRGAIAGALKARGYAVTSTADEAGRIYRIAPGEPQP